MKVPLEGHVSVCVQLNLKQQNSSSKKKFQDQLVGGQKEFLAFASSPVGR